MQSNIQVNTEFISLISCSKSLNEFVNAAMVVANSTGNIVYVLDSNYRIAMVSSGFCECFGIANPDDLIYRYLEEPDIGFFRIYRRFKSLLNEQHESIKNSKLTRVFLEVFNEQNNHKTLFSTRKTPIYSTDNEFIGIYVHMRLFSVARLANLGFKFFDIKGFPTARQEFQKVKLTRKQQMVLYLYARNYSYTEVSTWLSAIGYTMSPGRVNEHLDRLKQILNVSNKESLRDTSIKLGYDVAVPSEFLPEGIHDITDDIFDLWIC